MRTLEHALVAGRAVGSGYAALRAVSMNAASLGAEKATDFVLDRVMGPVVPQVHHRPDGFVDDLIDQLNQRVVPTLIGWGCREVAVLVSPSTVVAVHFGAVLHGTIKSVRKHYANRDVERLPAPPPPPHENIIYGRADEGEVAEAEPALEAARAGGLAAA